MLEVESGIYGQISQRLGRRLGLSQTARSFVATQYNTSLSQVQNPRLERYYIIRLGSGVET